MGRPFMALSAAITLFAAGMAVAFAAATPEGRQGTAPQPAGSSVQDGVYTQEQADRGRVDYEYYCGECHLHDLRGDPGFDVPPLAGEPFLAVWRGHNLGRLFEKMIEDMPVDSPGSLKRETYIDIIAYILARNGFPAGRERLTEQPERLQQILIDVQRATTD